MGLLDSLFGQSSYGGQGGGLLDFLRNNAMNQQFGSGLQSDQAQYGQPPMQAMAQTPMQTAPPPQAAQPMQTPMSTGPMPAPQAQPMQAPPQAQGLPPALGGVGSLLGRLGNPDGLIAKLTGNDSRSMAQQNLKAQYDALVPMLGQQKAMLAILNPEAGKTLIAQALEKKQYGFQKLDDGTVLRTDPMTGRAEPAYSAGTKPKFGIVGESDGQKVYGFIDEGKNKVTPYQAPGSETPSAVTGPDGKAIPIPPGVDPKTFRNEISRANAKAAAGEKTEVQAKSEKFGNKMEFAEKNLNGLDDKFTGKFEGTAARATEYLPGGKMMQTNEYQKYVQARDNFITALLRDESGAAIGSSEFNRYEKELFPQPGEGPDIIKQKREARKVAIEAMKKSAGPGYKSPDIGSASAATAPADPLGIR